MGIGSWSNIYNVVTGLRLARGIHQHANQSCVLDNDYSGSAALHCEGSQYIKEVLWRGYWGGLHNPKPGMDFVILD